jgi:hypothetical protein
MAPLARRDVGSTQGHTREPEACLVTSQPEPVKFPLPSSPGPYDTGPEMRALAARCPVNVTWDAP